MTERSTRSAARSTSPAASACRTAGTGSPGRGVPPAGPPVQLGDLAGPLLEQVGAQDVGEQVVVAVPLAAVVEGDDEQVRAVERLEHGLAVARRR